MEETLFKRTLGLIASRVGLLVREQDEALLRKVIAERVRALNLSGEQYCQVLESGEGIRRERREFAVRLTTGETYFFRDMGQHALLHDRILPELLEQRKAEHVLRIWCAACSSGEEAYSLAILLDELLGDQSPWDIQILGTDINHHAIEKAQRGVYTEWSFRGMSDERRQRYFRHQDDNWVLDDNIRNKVKFRPLDLVDDDFPDPAAGLQDMDLILCRNTFIYMTPPVVSHIADKFSETLRDGGYLITGHGELYAHHLGKLRARVFRESIVYQRAAVPVFSQKPASMAGTQWKVPERPMTEVPAAQKGKAEAPASPPQQAATVSGKETNIPQIQQAWQYANQGQRELAQDLCGAMIARDPLDAEAHYLVALLAQERGDFADAKELLKKVIYLAPSFIAAYLDLGDLYARDGDVARAAKMRSTARDLLKMLPGDEQLKLYGASTANEALQYIEHLLGVTVNELK